MIFLLHAWERFNEFLNQKEYSSIFLIMDENTQRECLPYFNQMSNHNISNTLIIPSGEQHKNLETCQLIWNYLIDEGIDRKSLIIGLGGGVLCDIVGFCASTVLRGVDAIYVPTSLMAQADAAVGGKTGINLEFFKNQIGSFYSPEAVLVDIHFLSTLPERHIKNGFVEIIKHAMIQEPNYLDDVLDLEWPVSKENLEVYIKKSIRTKSDIVEKDFYEQHQRKMLNFGHTIGHALESYFLSQNKDALHGECIAMGMIAESYISSELYNWKPHTLKRLTEKLKELMTPFRFSEAEVPQILELMWKDKKKQSAQMRFSLLSQPGKGVWDIAVSKPMIEKSLEYCQL
ncbi:MAG: 3-dehydroquinate synthase [Bacteroidota bacterium]|nr:3-dehydroquinate synthase [Bacteroidota bacterium]